MPPGQDVEGLADDWDCRSVFAKPPSRLRKRCRFVDGLVLPDGLARGGIVGQDAAFAAGDWGFVHLGQPFGQLGFFFGKFRIFGEVVPLVEIGFFVVEFFTTVSVADVAPVLGSDGVVALVVGGDGGPFARCAGVFELRHEAVTFQVSPRGSAGEFEQGGEDIEKLRRAAAYLPSLHTWTGK